MNEELIPCPFCGETDKLEQTWEEFGTTFIWCGRCHACGPGVDDDFSEEVKAAIRTLWNKRAMLPAEQPV